MKLALIYTIFNGLELLEQSANQIEADEVIIGWQKYSNTGIKSDTIERFIELMKMKHPEWHFVEYLPVKELNTKRNEQAKHNQLLNYAKSLHCSHFLISATDHFYDRAEFNRAKQIAKNYDCTTTKMFTYYKKPTYQITPIEDYEMLFICKLHKDSRFVDKKFPVLVDPALKLNTRDSFLSFSQDIIMMHHYSMIRQSIEDKFNNSASSINWSRKQKEDFLKEYESHKLGDSISYFKDRTTIEVDNYFNL